MPQVLKRRRVVNPGTRAKHKRKLTAKQIKFFGTKRQRAALKLKRHNPAKRKSSSMFKGLLKKSVRAFNRRARQVTKHKKVSNIGEILTILPGNPGRLSSSKRRVTNMARRKRRVGVARRRVHNRARRRRNYGTVVGRSFSHTKIGRRRKRNPGKVVVYRYRGRRHNPRRMGRRRRNPGMFGGTFGKVMGVIGGAAVTKVVTDKLPTALNGGFVGYLSTAVVAMLQGKLIGKVLKNPSLGQDMTIGGFTYLAIRVVNDFMPSLSLPFGLSGGRGMGLLAPSSFYVPQVNAPGSMSNFVVPAGIPVASATAMRGLGSARRVGRVS